MASQLMALCRLILHISRPILVMQCSVCDVMFNGYAKMRQLDALIGHILDIYQMHWTQTHQTHFRTALYFY